ncbi:Nucleolar RNA helicase 2 [Kappamyces sp. JEL0829]|nr:Nucleolar RNA helicase 2 [Kappamyces sp. JEL0829]
MASKKEKKEKKEKRKNSSDESPQKQKKPKTNHDVVAVLDQDVDSYRPSNALADKDEQDIPEELRLSSLGLSPSTLQSLQDRGVKQLFPIQAASFKPVMEGKDLLARARTGTGKTLAFSLPMVEALKREREKTPQSFAKRGRGPRVLIMAPTRELAIQVNKELTQICSGLLSTACFYGGTLYDEQRQALRDGLDIVVGTPGRLIDHIERGYLSLKSIQFVCMDEADQMLDIGFAEDMEKTLKLVVEQRDGQHTHQTLLFSATMPDWIKEAIKKYMKPDRVTLDLVGSSKQKTSSTVTHFCLSSRWQNRTDILGDIVACYGQGNNGRTIVFVETKNEANELVMNEKLVAMGAQVLHVRRRP